MGFGLISRISCLTCPNHHGIRLVSQITSLTCTNHHGIRTCFSDYQLNLSESPRNSDLFLGLPAQPVRITTEFGLVSRITCSTCTNHHGIRTYFSDYPLNLYESPRNSDLFLGLPAQPVRITTEFGLVSRISCLTCTNHHGIRTCFSD